MQNRGLYVAAALFVLAVGAFYIYDKGKPSNAPGSTPSASPAPLASPLANLDANQVSEVVVKANGKVLTVTRTATGFTYSDCPSGQTNCTAQIADINGSSQLFVAVVQIRPVRTIYGVSDQFPSFGLDKPTTAEIDIKTASGQTTVIWVGAKAPDGTSEYVRLATGSDVYAVSSSSIDTPIVALVDNPPAPVPTPSPSPAASVAPPAGPGLASPQS